MNSETGVPIIGPVRIGRTTLTTATAEMLREAIQKGVFPPGSKIPPEMELMEKLQVSRTTLREALRSLEEQHIIVRRRGLGTFVSPQFILKDLSVNFGISEMIEQAGMTPRTRAAVVRIEKPAPTVRDALQLSDKDRIVVVDRIRLADENPVVWSLDYMPIHLVGEEGIPTLDLHRMSLYDYLEQRYHLKITHGTAYLAPLVATKIIAAKLNLKPGSPLMYIYQTDYTADGTPVLHSEEYHIPDKFVFVINRRGPNW